ncbi:23S rRNA (uridine(2552)-2'-O)-methyltransferase RlmE [Methylophilus medardicus]|uniref:Ribosomal RNA large subunit methyltransferase E n=1 Tax=Methylophilus medardicus TaxID=2588534 RepID=A0A5B8CT72_9PROT|nr:23S rRNA (uridine(2552)-2'-O)-methyltransferase RlmE [Methylophilus medardicus]QDC44497.1 23S rRNA (uridine(2552)-2'-O)-methyltransferase RlmE [Methylophilus medardicus]QDC49504.1 23S rRNA (uridine(2552)-2'-O)-methyltransferase RlmE [Methylophilus medardicus]QDC53209.1 23S rRNA (uridine(2552)-2'-O)-methyltransferase RlmE [Methylophilus medardicus]
MKPSKTSKAWMQEHLNDPFVKQAQKDGYRARAAYKLLEIDDKDKLIKPGMTVVDLGSTPGSWSQVAVQRIKGQGRVIALDILEMHPIPGVEFICGDFREETVLKQLEATLNHKLVDLVIADMAPNMSGLKDVDQAGATYLTELALDFCQQWLKPGGNILVKVFIGSGFDDIVKQMRDQFEKVVTRKPKASRDRSSEVYLLGLQRKA